ncbi:MAG TPA: glycosyltransferase [Vicinamibacterales bacterium]|nr:glycosyltransferase [Vicinamibacterales bacterium]
MKIVHLLGWYFPDSVGGTEVYVEGLCRRLKEAGHEVLVAAPDPHRTAPEEYAYHGVPVFRYPITDHPTRDESYHRVSLRGTEHLFRWLADQRPDILHVHSIKTGVGLPEFREAHRLGIRVIATCHLPSLGYLCRTGELMEGGKHPCDGIVWPSKCAACSLTHVGLPPLASRIAGAIPPPLGEILRVFPGKVGTVLGMSALVVEYQKMQRELFQIVERFVVLNETAYRMLVADGAPAGKLVINRLGVSQTEIAPKPGPDVQPTRTPVRFGFAGRLHPAKGLTQMVRAVLAIPRDVDLRLDIRAPILDAGARAMAEDLRRLAADDPRIHFEPAVSSSEILPVLAELDVLLSPSLWFENGPTIALEAMAVGTPVIGSRVGNLAEIIEDHVTGRLVEAGSVPELSAALLEAATNPASTIDRWRRALPPVRTMDDIARDYMTMYAA